MDKVRFYDHNIACRGRVMDVFSNFLVCIDTIEPSQELRAEVLSLLERLGELSAKRWPIL